MNSKSIRKFTVGLFLILLTASSCTSTRIAILTTTENDEIELFTTKLPHINEVLMYV